MKTINLKSQAELEKAELQQQIESFINKKKELMTFYNEVLSSEKLQTLPSKF